MPGAGPVELGRHDGPARAVAVLPDGRVVSAGGDDGLMLVWDPAVPGASPVELGQRGVGPVRAVSVLPDGRMVCGGDTGWVREWDPALPGAGPVELGRHGGPVRAVSVLPDGRVVSGGDDGCMRVWDVAGGTEIARVVCSVTALATALGTAMDQRLLTANAGQGMTMWSMRMSQKAQSADATV
jgi:WD40 repeat protein